MVNEPDLDTLQRWFTELTKLPANRFHPLVWIVGDPVIGKDVYIGGFTEVNAKGASVCIGDRCDIASFVSINCADSHKKCIGLANEVSRENIFIEHDVFIGSHSVIKGGAYIGHHSVVAAGAIVGRIFVPPFSLVVGNPAVVRAGYYIDKFNAACNPSQ